MRKLTTKEFIAKCKSRHGDRYDYSKTVYINARVKISIVCKTHGMFDQFSHNHLQGNGCHSCAVDSQKLTAQEFISKATAIHGDTYDYSKVVYVNHTSKVWIGCKIHGYFEQTVNSHLDGKRCQKCAGNGQMTSQEFISKATAIHGDTYLYDRVDYKTNHVKVSIGCKIHGYFEQTPAGHLTGNGCQKCARTLVGSKCRLTSQEFISKATAVHGDKYLYDRAEYKTSADKVWIGCKIHGYFEQVVTSHLTGSGCSSCVTGGGYNTLKPATLYYLRVQPAGNAKPLYKIGITNRTVQLRFTITELKSITVLDTYQSDDGGEILAMESAILCKFKADKYTGPDILKNGNTELFNRDILNGTIPSN